MNFELNETQRLIQETARNFAQKELAPVAEKLDQEGDRKTFLKNLKKLAELGLMGVNINSEYGGSEAGVVSFSVAMTEIAKACASTAVTMSVSNMVAEVIQEFGSEEHKQKYISNICSGEYPAGAFALTETTAGSDAANIHTSAVLKGDEWILNGNKLFITSGEYAGVFCVWAVTDKDAKRGRGISVFAVEPGDPGFSVGRAERKMGQHGSSTTELIFDNCRIPKDRLMGKLNDGYRIALYELSGGRIGIGSLALGIGLAAIDYAKEYAKTRTQFGRPITDFQAIQWMIAESYTELEASRLLLLNAAFRKETKRPFVRQASMAKYFSTEAADRACYNAVQILGGYGYTQEFPVERYARDVRVTCIYEGTNQIQRLVIARDILRNQS